MVHSGRARHLTEAGSGKAKPSCPANSLLGLKGPHALLSRTHRRSPVLSPPTKLPQFPHLELPQFPHLELPQFPHVELPQFPDFSVGSVPIHTFRVEGPNRPVLDACLLTAHDAPFVALAGRGVEQCARRRQVGRAKPPERDSVGGSAPCTALASYSGRSTLRARRAQRV
jgi:hypothetical protein